MAVAEYDEIDAGIRLAVAAGGTALEQAILATLIYSDLFDYPLTLDEIVLYLIGCRAGPDEIGAALAQPWLAERVQQQGGYHFLAGRGEVVALRRGRADKSARLWRRARRYRRLLCHLPFVQLIAVTGALAMDNVNGNEDIDLLVVANPGRVWIARRFLIMTVRLSRLLGDELCPNYVLAADALALPERDLFTAHELAQMRPLHGEQTYRRMLGENRWYLDLLPNGGRGGLPAADDSAPRHFSPRPPLEAALRRPAFDRWERAELARMRARVRADADGEVAFNERQCKGHTGLYRQHALKKLEERLATYGVPLSAVALD